MLILPLMPNISAAAGSEAALAHFKKAQLQFENGDHAGARSWLSRALKADNSFAEARVLLGRIYLRTEKPAAAEWQIRRALEVRSDASSREERQILLGRSLLKQRKFRQVLAVLPPEEASPRRLLSSLVLHAEAKFGLGEHEQAVSLYERALRVDPGMKEAKLGLARTRIAQGRHSDARTLIDGLVAQAPRNPAAWQLRAEVDSHQDRLEDAIAAYSKAIELASDDAFLYCGRAKMLIRLADYDKAEIDLRSALKHRRGYLPARYLLALVSLAKGDAETADNRFMAVANKLHNYVPAQLLEGLIKHQTGQRFQATKSLFRYTYLEQDTVLGKQLLAAWLLQNNILDTALDAANALARQDAEDVTSAWLLASIHMRRGEFAETAQTLSRIATLDNAAGATLAAQFVALLDTGKSNESESGGPAQLNSDAMSLARTIAIITDDIRIGRLKAAKREIESLRVEGSNPSIAANLQALWHIARGERARARDELIWSLQRHGASAMTLANIAQIEMTDGKLESAAARLEKARTLSPGSEWISLLSARHAAMSGGLIEARDQAKEIGGRKATLSPLAKAAIRKITSGDLEKRTDAMRGLLKDRYLIRVNGQALVLAVESSDVPSTHQSSRRVRLMMHNPFRYVLATRSLPALWRNDQALTVAQKPLAHLR